MNEFKKQKSKQLELQYYIAVEHANKSQGPQLSYIRRPPAVPRFENGNKLYITMAISENYLAGLFLQHVEPSLQCALRYMTTLGGRYHSMHVLCISHV